MLKLAPLPHKFSPSPRFADKPSIVPETRMSAELELCQKARQALAQGDAQTARQCYLQALASAPEAADIHYGLGTTCFMLSDLKGAVYHFSQTINYEPQKVGAHINLGAVYNQLGQADDALQVLRKAIKLDNKRAEIYYNMGLAYRAKSQAELAIQAYREALHLNPKMVDSHFNLGNLLQELGRLPQAHQHYKEALKLDPGFSAAQVGLYQVEKALNPDASASSTRLGQKPKSDPTVDMNQPIDIRFDGPALQALHRTTIVCENAARDLSRVLQDELEVAIKELSSALLYSNTSVTELSDRLEKLQNTMSRAKALQKTWQQGIHKIHQLNNKLMQPLQSLAAAN